MEHWSVEDYKNFANNKIKKSKYRANTYKSRSRNIILK